MKKAIQFLLLLAAVFPSGLYAQNVVHIEDVQSNLEEMKPMYKFRLPLWEIAASPYNASIYDANVGAVFAHQNFLVTADYSYSLLDRFFPNSYEDGAIEANTVTQMIMFPLHETNGANYFELGGTYFFTHKIVEKEIKIVLSAGRNYERYTMVPGEQLNRWGARLGFTRGVTWYAFNEANIKARAQDGTVTAFNYNIMSSTRDYANINIGFCFSKTTNMTVWVREFGKRSNSGIEMFYADALIATKNNLDDVYSAIYYDGSEGTMFYQPFDLNKDNEKSKIGFRIGYKCIPFRGIIGWHIDGGINPGLKAAKNFFFTFGASFYLGNKP